MCMSYQMLNFTQQQVVETGSALMRQVLDLCPQQYPQEIFSCLTQITSDVQHCLVLKFIPYSLGSGILANVSTKSDQQLIEEQMYLQAKASKQYAVLYKEKMKKYKEELNRR